MSLIKKYLLLLLVPITMIGLLITKVDIRTDITDFFFAGNNADSAFLVNQLNSDNLQRQIVLSIAHPKLDADLVVDFMDQFRAKLAQFEDTERVWSQALDEDQLKQLIDLYSTYKINLFSTDPKREISALFETDNLKQRLQQIKSLLLGPDPELAKKYLKSDPMLLTLDWLDHIQMTVKRSKQLQDYSTVFVESVADGMDLIAQQKLLARIGESFALINEQFDNKFSMQWTGIPVFAIAIKSEISKDISRVSTLSMLVIITIFIVIFCSLKSLILTAILLLTTVGGAALVTQLVFGFVHGLTLALGATLIGICIDYFIHAMINASEGEPSQYTEKIKKIWPSLILGGATTILGYIALAVSGFPGLQQVAVFSVSGIVVALLMTRYIIPIVMIRFSFRLQPRLSSDSLLAIMSSQKIAVSLLAFVLVCFILGVSAVSWSENLDTLTPELEQLKSEDAIIRSRMANIAPGRFILSEATDLESALQINEKLHLELEKMRDQGIVEEYFSVYPWIASQKLQSENKHNWNNALNLRNLDRWKSALEKAGFSAQAFPDLKTAGAQIIDLKQIEKSPAWQLLSRQMIFDDQQVTLATWLGEHEVSQLKQALMSMQGVRYFSHKESIDALARDYRLKAQRLLFAGLAAIFLLLLGRFRSATTAIKLLLPAMMAILFVFGLAGLIARPMNMIHLIGLLLTAAICVDYAIFFFENRSNNQTLTFQAITASALTSSASFACLGIAQNPALQALAWTVAPGIIIGFLLCPVILRRGPKKSQQENLIT